MKKSCTKTKQQYNIKLNIYASTSIGTEWKLIPGKFIALLNLISHYPI